MTLSGLGTVLNLDSEGAYLPMCIYNYIYISTTATDLFFVQELPIMCRSFSSGKPWGFPHREFTRRPVNPHLVGGKTTPLKNVKISWDDYSQYMEKYKMFQTTNQPFFGD